MGKLKSISTVLKAEQKNDLSKTFDSAGELAKLLVDVYESQNSRKRGHFVLFNLNSAGDRVMQLGPQFPQWLRKLLEEVISNFPEHQISNRNYRLVFADADSD